MNVDCFYYCGRCCITDSAAAVDDDVTKQTSVSCPPPDPPSTVFVQSTRSLIHARGYTGTRNTGTPVRPASASNNNILLLLVALVRIFPWEHQRMLLRTSRTRSCIEDAAGVTILIFVSTLHRTALS